MAGAGYPVALSAAPSPRLPQNCCAI